MVAICGRKAKIYIETKDGDLIDLDAADLSISTSVEDMFLYENRYIDEYVVKARPRFLQNSLSFTAYLDNVYTRSAWQEHVDDLKKSPEWRCSYCGSPNPREYRHCSQCGAARGFIYG